MDEAMELFWEDLESGDVHIRDRWQFAFETEFYPVKDEKNNQFTQEFYLFIPRSLQINSSTYSKQQFYLDETNLIRYKTPEFSFSELLDLSYPRSPLTRVVSLCDQTETGQHKNLLSDELKLFANVLRSTTRRTVKLLAYDIKRKLTSEQAKLFSAKTLELCGNLKKVRERYASAEHAFMKNWNDPDFYRKFLYVDEFISHSTTHFLTGLLENIRLTGRTDMQEVDNAICELLLSEKQLGDTLEAAGPRKTVGDTIEAERLLYRDGLLNKFVLGALTLNTNRYSFDLRYQHWIGGIAAGIAMLLYFSLFVWLGTIFVINSEPFIIIAVFFYIIKDRLKEWLKSYSYLQASKWYPDYTTTIKSSDDKKELGYLKEYFAFIDPKQLPDDLRQIRNVDFNTVLEPFERPENIIFYKKVVEINPPVIGSRRHGLKFVFRFNIHQFLNKAADPTETHLMIEPSTRKLVSVRFSKVYHLNLIIRTTFPSDGTGTKQEIKALRLVIDKNGIKRIEPIQHEH